jgi:hypothetical protein
VFPDLYGAFFVDSFTAFDPFVYLLFVGDRGSVVFFPGFTAFHFITFFDVFVLFDLEILLNLVTFFHVFGIANLFALFFLVTDLLLVTDFVGFVFGYIVAFFNILTFFNDTFFVFFTAFGTHFVCSFFDIEFVPHTDSFLSAFFHFIGDFLLIGFAHPFVVGYSLNTGDFMAFFYIIGLTNVFAYLRQSVFFTTDFLVFANSFVAFLVITSLNFFTIFFVFFDPIMDFLEPAFLVLDAFFGCRVLATVFLRYCFVTIFQTGSIALPRAFGRPIHCTSMTTVQLFQTNFVFGAH